MTQSIFKKDNEAKMRIRTGYSFKTAAGKIEDVLARLKELGWESAPITDRLSTFGFNRWNKACEKNKLRPIFGVELATVPRWGEKKPVYDFWTFLAVNDLEPLHKAIGRATEGHDREPSLTYEMALGLKGIVKIAGEHLQLELDGKEILKPQKDLYVALSPSLPVALYKKLSNKGFQFIMTSDNYYPTVDDREYYRVLLGRSASTQTYPQHILSTDEWLDSVWFASEVDKKSAMLNFRKVQKQCQAKMIKADLLVPEKKKSLRQMCIDGAKRTGTDLNNKVYKDRLDKELKLIAEKDFEDYFYIIADMVSWAKQRMIVGPARGSSCGSLVCYLLNITSIDPIPYDLIFERFIDVNRMDLPDIDIDFSDDRRSKVFEYAEEKYGKDHVARLGTVGLFKPKSVLNAAGISLRVPKWLIEKVSDGLIERSGGDSRAMMALEDTLATTDMGKKLLSEYPEFSIAKGMEGHPHNASQHAAGIIITNSPVTKFVAVDSRTKSAMCDKKDAEDLNMLKIDALGLTQLSIFERTLDLIGEKSINGFLEKLPLNSKKAFEVLNKGHFSGIFQYMGMALQSLTKQVKIESIEDIITITALARPGPMATGGAGQWVKRRTGAERTDYVTPLLKPHTQNTYGIVVYQEQVMNVVRSLGKMSWADTSDLRKGMSRSMGDEFFEKYWVKFQKGAKENGIDEGLARVIWEQVNKFGSWAFNRSHAVAYGMVSYWCCWLKAHHPLEFAAATLDAEYDPLRQIELLRELDKEGIGYVSVDQNVSTDKWAIDKKKKRLVGPLTQIKGIGPATVDEILDARKHNKPLRETLIKRLKNAVTEIDTLYPIGDKIKELHPEREWKLTPRHIKDVQCGVEGDVMVLAVITRIAPRDENDAQNVQKRGYEVSGPTQALNMFFRDDTDEIFCKINRYRYNDLGPKVIEKGRPKKSLYAVMGNVPPKFRMIDVKRIEYLGDLKDGGAE